MIIIEGAIDAPIFAPQMMHGPGNVVAIDINDERIIIITTLAKARIAEHITIYLTPALPSDHLFNTYGSTNVKTPNTTTAIN
ncbi:MAG: hypothetical protein NTU95_00300 [Methanothrix sp.]|nr:hypothetical protein [Methanothrix sp.]